MAVKDGGQMISHNSSSFKGTLLVNAVWRPEILVSNRTYFSFMDPQLKHGLTISYIISSPLRKLEACHNEYLRRIFGGSSRSSFKVMLHLVSQPSMRERIAVLQAQFLCRSLYLSQDTLLSMLLPFLQASSSISQWYKLIKSPLWSTCNNLEPRRDGPNSKLLSACRFTLTVDPILWLPMPNIERSRTLRWHLGWLPGGQPQPCLYHPNAQLFPLTCDPLPPHAPMPFLSQLR
ncbi:MAG: hypothetical protein EXX96DRAFT_621933 [Benjaminiella poitrasii]|nr:MAG: hypothetical protein EXX96DRAFT_621933 [Benjaminiella poitrasii]